MNNRQSKSAIKEEDIWLFESALQFCSSPLFQGPLNEFIDGNCINFLDSKHITQENVKLFEDFKKITDNLLSTLSQDLGTDLNKIQELITIGLKYKEYQKIFWLYKVYSDFKYFIKVMVKHNLDLETQAFQDMQFSNQQENVEYQQADKELEKALEESLKLQDVQIPIKNNNQNDDENLKAIMAISKLEHEEKERKIKEQEEDELEQVLKMSKLESENQQQNKDKQQCEEFRKFEEQKFQQDADNQDDFADKEQKEFDDIIFSSRQNLFDRLDKIDTSPQKQEQSPVKQESFEEKKARLIKQREMLLAKKKQQRDVEMQEFSEKQLDNDDNKQQSDKETLEKRKNQYVKIKQNLKN